MVVIARLPKDMETISKDASAEAAGLGLLELLQWMRGHAQKPLKAVTSLC